MSNDNCSKLLVINQSSSTGEDEIIKIKCITDISEHKVIVINEINKYLSDSNSDLNSTTSPFEVEGIIQEIASKQEGSRFLQDLIFRLPICSEYIFQIVSRIIYNILD